MSDVTERTDEIDRNRGTAPSESAQFVTLPELVEIAVVIVSYQSALDLPDLISSLRSEANGVFMRVVVVDNASTDGSAEIAASYGDVIVVNSGGNVGYAAGINLGMSYVGDAREVLVLNPDLVVEPGFVKRLQERRASTGAAVVVPRIVDSDGTLFRSLRREPSVRRIIGDALFGRHLPNRPSWLSESVRSDADYARASRVAWATGAAMLVDRKAWDAVGQWDEHFFLYSEETDFCYRMRMLGFEVWYEPLAVARHRRGGSGASPDLVALLMVNRLRYMMKHHPRSARLYRVALIIHEELRRSDTSHDLARQAIRSRRLWPALPKPHFNAVPIELFPPASIVIVAGKEAAAERCVIPLMALVERGTLEVIVVLWDCPGDAVVRLRRHAGVVVVETRATAKAAAVGAGDRLASRWPRLYLDADTSATPETLASIVQALQGDGILVARPELSLETNDATALARSYLRARGRMPSSSEDLWGTGLFGLNQCGYNRIGGDVNGLCGLNDLIQAIPPGRRRIVFGTPLLVNPPQTARSLLNALVSSRQDRRPAEPASVGRVDFVELFGTVVGLRSCIDAITLVVFATTAHILSVSRSGTVRGIRARQMTCDSQEHPR